MPIYEYECSGCQVIYEVLQGVQDAPLEACPGCRGAVARILSAPNMNLRNFSGRTEARLARFSSAEEVARERELQKSYETLRLPPGVKHNPWDRKA